MTDSPSRERIAQSCVCCGGRQLAGSPAVLMPFVADRVFGWAPVEIDDSWGLQTIRKGMAYTVCKSLLCRSCGLLFLDIRFSDPELANLYRDYRGPEYTALRDAYEPGYAERNARLMDGLKHLDAVETFLAPHVRPEGLRILDWGGDTGDNTPMRRHAAVHLVHDISNRPLVEGARRATADDIASRSHDLIVCSSVLEHIPHPGDMLSAMAQACGDGTLVYLEVPYEDLMRDGRPDPHLRKRHWHEHINFFSRQALERLVGSCGLGVVDSREVAVNVAGKDAHLLQMICRRTG